MTRLCSYDNLNPKCLSDIFQVAVNCLQHIDEELGDDVQPQPQTQAEVASDNA